MKVSKYISLVIIVSLLIQCGKQPKFELLLPCQEKENTYWGYINFNGNRQIDPLFKEIPGMFYEGYALIETTDGSVDYINKQGNEFERNYIDATDFQEGIAFAVKEDEYPCILDSELKEIRTLEKVDEIYVPSEGLICYKNTRGKWGYMNTNFDIVIEPVYDAAYSFSDGLALVKKTVYDTTNEKKVEKVLCGFIDAEGNEIIRPTTNLSIVRSFSEGMAAYSDDYEWGWGFIDKSGRKVIRAKKEWQSVTDFNEGVASVQISGLWGLINKKGNIILNCKYDDPLVFSDGLAPVEKDDKIGFINKRGKWIIGPVFDDILMGFTNRKAIVEQDNYYIFINRRGKQTVDNEFYNVGFSASLNSTVRSDFFDIEPVIDTLIFQINANSINGLSESTTLPEVMKKYQLTNSDLPEDSWDKYIELEDISMDDEVDIETTFYFNKNVSIPIKQITSYNYWWYYEEIVGYKPNTTAILNSIEFEIELSGRKEGKADKLAKGFKKLFEQYNYSLDEKSSSDDEYVLTNPDDTIRTTIEFEDDYLSITINF